MHLSVMCKRTPVHHCCTCIGNIGTEWGLLTILYAKMQTVRKERHVDEAVSQVIRESSAGKTLIQRESMAGDFLSRPAMVGYYFAEHTRHEQPPDNRNYGRRTAPGSAASG